MSLEYDINLAVLNLPNSIDIVGFFSHTLKAFYWEYDDLGRKPIGLDNYLIKGHTTNWDRSSMKIHISMRSYESRFTDIPAVLGEICKGKLNGRRGYSLSFTVERRADVLYGRTKEEYIRMLRQYFNEHLALKRVKLSEVSGFKDAS